jgi:RNA polymerase sigma factor (sigma-70 family)
VPGLSRRRNAGEEDGTDADAAAAAAGGDLNALARAAREGDRAALDRLVVALSDDLYRLALRMVWHPEDAEDATQEILIRILTRLDGWRGEASVRTWAWRIAVHHLLDRRRSRMEAERWTFDAFGEDLAAGLADPRPGDAPGDEILADEVRLGCTQGMLQCLDRPHRVAYILGEVFALPSELAAEVTGVSAPTHRKRLSRARAALRSFVADHCGIVDPANRCRCAKRVPRAIELGRVDPERPLFAAHPSRPRATEPDRPTAETTEMQHLHDLAALMRSHPAYAAPDRVRRTLQSLLDGGRLRLLDG